MDAKCKNCGNQLSGDFCSQCGQKSRLKRIDFNYIVNEIPNDIFQVNRGFFFTMKELTIRPGHSIREFLEGQRIRHYKPIGFLLITTTIYVLTSFLFERNTFFADVVLGFEQGANEGMDIADTAMSDWISKYQVYIPLIVLPIFSISTYVAFIKSRYNYFEHLVINFYITGQQMIIYWIFGFIFIEENDLLVIPIFIGFVYNFWTFNQFFMHKKFVVKNMLIVLSYILVVIGFFAMLIVGAGIARILN